MLDSNSTSIYIHQEIEFQVQNIISDFTEQFKPTYLYVKKHSKTGFMYFGKTTQTDPIKYLGSGTHWKNHYKKHGKDFIQNVFLKYFINLEECVRFAITFSVENNIVESPHWANKIVEDGIGILGGGMEGKHHTEQGKINIGTSQLGKLNHMYGKIKDKHHLYGSGNIIEQYSLEHIFIREGYSVDFKEFGFEIRNIANCCRMKRPTCGGYIFKYKGDLEFIWPNLLRTGKISKIRGQIIQQYSTTNELIDEGLSTHFKDLGYATNTIYEAIKTGRIRNNSIWKYK